MDFSFVKEARIKSFIKKNKKINNYPRSIISLLIILILSFLFYKIYHYIYKYNHCFECIQNNNNINPKYSDCPKELLFQNLYIESDDNTIDEIIKHNKSIARYGDGEYLLMFGLSIFFQKYSLELAERLIEILNSKEENLLIGIYFPIKKSELDLYTDIEKNYWKRFTERHKLDLLKIIQMDKKFYSAGISKFYLKKKDKSGIGKYVLKLKKIWEGRDVVIIEPEISKQGIGNDLFDNIKSIKRIICPEKNAFEIYYKILREVLKVDKNNLILISLGPTATILSHDLSKLGYQAIDIGHVDFEYELYLRNATRWIFKNEKKEVFENQTQNYYKEIIIRIIE
jgi:glycosyltransferase family protein